MFECIVCDAELSLGEETIVGELITCADCGTELEVTGINPFSIQEAPQVQEDWGE